AGDEGGVGRGAHQVLEPAVIGEDQGGEVVGQCVLAHLRGELHSPGVVEGAQGHHDASAPPGAHRLRVPVGDVAQLGGGRTHLLLRRGGPRRAGGAAAGEHAGGGGQRGPGRTGDVRQGHGPAARGQQRGGP